MTPDSTLLAWRRSADRDARSEVALALNQSGLQTLSIPSQEFEARTSTFGGVRDIELAALAPAGPSWWGLLLPLRFTSGAEVARELSKGAEVAFVFEEFEQRIWGYRLFAHGQEVDAFASGRVSGRRVHPRRSLDVLAKQLGVEAAVVAPYLRPSLLQRLTRGKAFPGDQFEIKDHWVRTDFMRRLGIMYPDLQSAERFRIGGA